MSPVSVAPYRRQYCCRSALAASASSPSSLCRYSVIARLMCGKMCGLALWSVLSRSKIQTREAMRAPALPTSDQGSDAFARQDLEEQRVLDAPVDDMAGVDAVLHRVE